MEGGGECTWLQDRWIFSSHFPRHVQSGDVMNARSFKIHELSYNKHICQQMLQENLQIYTEDERNYNDEMDIWEGYKHIKIRLINASNLVILVTLIVIRLRVSFTGRI